MRLMRVTRKLTKLLRWERPREEGYKARGKREE